MTGSVKFSPDYPSAANPNGSAGNIRVKIKATLVNCKGAGAAAAVTGGSLQFSTSLDAGAGCADLLLGSPGFYNPGKFQVRWTGGDPLGSKHPTIGISKNDATVGLDSDQAINGGWELDTTFIPGTAFANQSAALDIVIDNIGVVGACAFGSKDPATGQFVNVTEVDFSAKGGSTLTVTP